ncbi:hypothetical protein ACPCSC_32900 [Streptomyces lavendulocolor]|uniref:hypothetical protein n=1 Tax=Streptomyces lavendulocolor TaxID=67316 RepID=UPI003C3093EE
MIIANPGSRRQSLFCADEPVIQGRPLLPQARQEGARVPLFGDTAVMDFNGVVAKPANRNPSWWRIRFAGVLAEPNWNLLAREIVMILANPQHEQLQAHGLHFGFDPWDIGTINLNMGCLRGLITWARKEGLPDDAGCWNPADLKQRITALRTQVEPATLTRHVAFLKKLASFAPVLSCAWPAEDPWPGKLAGQVAKDVRDGELSTKAIPPEIWFPLIRAAWTYIHTYSADILGALRLTEQLRQAAVSSAAGKDADLDRFLADPANKVPCHYDPEWPADLPPEVHWTMLCLLLGVKESFHGSLFGRSSAASRARRAKVLRAVHEGRHSYGLPLDLTQVRRPAGSTGPWHPGFDLYDVSNLATTLRNAAFVLVAALSMMRDSELQEIARGSVVEHLRRLSVGVSVVVGRRRGSRRGRRRGDRLRGRVGGGGWGRCVVVGRRLLDSVVTVTVAVATWGRLHRGCDLAQPEESEGRHRDDGQTQHAEDALPGSVGVLDHVGDEGDDDADGDEDGAAGGKVVEVLKAAAEHADAEGEHQRGADHHEHAGQAGPLAGEEELVEDNGAEEDERAVGGDAGVAVGVERMVDDGTADETGADEVADIAKVAGGQRALPGRLGLAPGGPAHGRSVEPAVGRVEKLDGGHVCEFLGVLRA